MPMFPIMRLSAIFKRLGANFLPPRVGNQVPGVPVSTRPQPKFTVIKGTPSFTDSAGGVSASLSLARQFHKMLTSEAATRVRRLAEDSNCLARYTLLLSYDLSTGIYYHGKAGGGVKVLIYGDYSPNSVHARISMGAEILTGAQKSPWPTREKTNANILTEAIEHLNKMQFRELPTHANKPVATTEKVSELVNLEQVSKFTDQLRSIFNEFNRDSKNLEALPLWGYVDVYTLLDGYLWLDELGNIESWRFERVLTPNNKQDVRSKGLQTGKCFEVLLGRLEGDGEPILLNCTSVHSETVSLQHRMLINSLNVSQRETKTLFPDACELLQTIAEGAHNAKFLNHILEKFPSCREIAYSPSENEEVFVVFNIAKFMAHARQATMGKDYLIVKFMFDVTRRAAYAPFTNMKYEIVDGAISASQLKLLELLKNVINSGSRFLTKVK